MHAVTHRLHKRYPVTSCYVSRLRNLVSGYAFIASLDNREPETVGVTDVLPHA